MVTEALYSKPLSGFPDGRGKLQMGKALRRYYVLIWKRFAHSSLRWRLKATDEQAQFCLFLFHKWQAGQGDKQDEMKSAERDDDYKQK